ncbi:MAG: hypothetical protein NC324_02675 [Bacteroides sp.]|nr:hypothetical protein [Bacteroides sp.]
MNNTLGKEYVNRAERIAFLKDNCDACENKGYMKPYTPDELQGHKEKLANTCIEISQIEAELRQVRAEYKGRLKPLIEERDAMVSNIKAKAEYVTEECYRFTLQDEKKTAYYNGDGDMIECRPATAEEMQISMFHPVFPASEATGTND